MCDLQVSIKEHLFLGGSFIFVGRIALDYTLIVLEALFLLADARVLGVCFALNLTKQIWTVLDEKRVIKYNIV